jgi:hypothetical protein
MSNEIEEIVLGRTGGFYRRTECVRCLYVSWFNLKMEPVNVFETSTINYQLTWIHIVENCNGYYLNICHKVLTASRNLYRDIWFH